MGAIVTRSFCQPHSTLLVLQPQVRLLLDRLCNFLIAPIDIDDGSNINSDKMKDGYGRSFRISQKAKSKLPPRSFPTTPTPELLFNKKVRRYVPQDIYNYIYKDDDDGGRSELRLTDNVLVVSSSLDADRGVFAVPHYADNKSVGCG